MLRRETWFLRSNANQVRTLLVDSYVLVDNWKLAFNPDGKEIVTAGELGKIQGFDVEEKELLTNLKSADVFATAISYVKPIEAMYNNINIEHKWKIFGYRE